MLDINFIRNNTDKVKDFLSKRGSDVSVIDKLMEMDKKRRKLLSEINTLMGERKRMSKKIDKLSKEESKVAKNLKSKIKIKEEELKKIQEEFNDMLLLIPNVIDDSVPIGKDESENKVIYQSSDVKKYDFEVKPHWEIGEELGILDFKTASVISGSRFAVLKGDGAKLERALINFMIDLHTKEHGYTEIFAPYLVKREIMVGTGQLPKFEIEMYRCRDDELYLIPTAEVSITNLHRDKILDEDELPIKYVSYSACFRREAGSYGKDTKGLIRNHQFNKVELVKMTKPEDSKKEFESLVEDAIDVIKKLGLTYRVVAVCSGDLGFSSSKTYDLEVWMPGEKRWRELSSCSLFLDFQARRMGLKFRRKNGKIEFVHTINGSGLAIGRTLASILENYQTKDGEIIIHEVLRPYVGIEKIKKKG